MQQVWRIYLTILPWLYTFNDDVIQVGPEGILAFSSSDSTDTGNSSVGGVMTQTTATAAATAGIEFASAVHNKLLFALPDTAAITATANDADTAASTSSDAMITTDATTAAAANDSTAIVSAVANKSSVRPVCENSATRRVAFEVSTHIFTYIYLSLGTSTF
jgi:hypothetical protein